MLKKKEQVVITRTINRDSSSIKIMVMERKECQQLGTLKRMKMLLNTLVNPRVNNNKGWSLDSNTTNWKLLEVRMKKRKKKT